jgi:hypothetical protein
MFDKKRYVQFPERGDESEMGDAEIQAGTLTKKIDATPFPRCVDKKNMYLDAATKPISLVRKGKIMPRLD